jgi:AcrR family transcriptional regulator
MSQHTKKLITECAMRLAEKKMINKITVREIVEECEITRNTFYYHFHDIYDVFTTHLVDTIDELIAEDSDNAEAVLFDFIEICTNYRKMLLNLYKSIGYEALAKFVKEKLRTIIKQSIEKEYDISRMGSFDLDIICTFYEEAIYGIMMRWLLDSKYDSFDDMKDRLERIRFLFDGQLELLIGNVSKQ